jgi:FAD:protein FMN transferase
MIPNRRNCLKHWLGWSMVAGSVIAAPTNPVKCTRVDVEDDGLQGFEAEFPSMGSKINLRWYANQSDRNQTVVAATEIADYWNSVLSDYDPSSQTSTACTKADSIVWVPLSNDLWSVIKQCDLWNRWSNGAFDAALGATTRLRRQRKPATQAQWAQAKLASGWGLLELDHSTQSMRFSRPGIRLDFGAIGKGIVVDRIAERFVAMGIERFVVNASGNMRMGLAPDKTTGWPIAIDLPMSATEVPAELLRTRIENGGVATSGDRWQRFPDATTEGSDSRTSHILEPITGNGLSGHQSVTIFADNATDADAAATATCVRARRDLAGWLQTLSIHKPNLRAIVLLKDNDSDPVRMISAG